jgi:hypothetical protein
MEDLVARLPVPDPFDISAFAEAIAASRGRPVLLRAMDMPSCGPSGLLVSTREVDYILYERDTAALHRYHIILHEMGHLICGHVTAQELLPTLDASVVRRVLGRTTYEDPQEREAERFAMLVLDKAGWLPGPPDDVLARIEQALS